MRAMFDRLARIFTVPEWANPAAFFTSLAGVAMLCAGFGVQAILTTMLLVEPPARDVEEYTLYGATLWLPEYDIHIYLAGIVFTLFLTVVAVRLWHLRIAAAGQASDRFLFGSGIRLMLAGLLATGAFGVQYIYARAYAARGEAVPARFLLGFAAVALASVGAARIGGRSKPDNRLTERLSSLAARMADGSSRKLSPFDVLIPVAVIVLVYVVDWPAMAGRFWLEESLVHWDYFAMGPALSVRHGVPLGEVHSTYGVGWPLVFGYLSHLVPISWGRLIQVGSAYACVYFIGLYALLRLLVRPAAAALGTIAMLLHLILGMGDVILWRIPSVSLLRWPMDVWCFIAVVLHYRTGKRVWAMLAGAAVGLALVFVLDTGLYLAAGFAFYWLCTLGVPEARALKPWFLRAVVVGLVVFLLFTGIASRGTIFGAEFWRYYVESVLEFAGGFGMLPLATAPNIPTLIAFAVFVFAGFSCAGHAVVKAMYRRASFLDALIGFLGLYSLLCFLHFIGRSGDFTIFRLWIPLGIVVVCLVDRFSAAVAGGVRERLAGTPKVRALAAGPALFAVAGLAVLAAVPDSYVAQPFREYPNALNHFADPPDPEQLCLLEEPRDICGIPARLEPTAVQFRQIADRLKEIDAAGKSFAAIEESGAMVYLASDTAPWGRYSRLFVSLRSKEQLERATQELEDHPVDYVLTRRMGETDATYNLWPLYSFGYGQRPDSVLADSYDAFNEIIQRDYELESSIGPFELRRRINGSN